MRGQVFSRFALVALAIVALAATASAGVLRSELAPIGDVAFNAGEPVLVQFTLSNPTNEDIFILRYETPLGGFERDLFQVSRDGEPIPYIGMLVLRAGVRAEDWVKVPAGGSVSEVIDLASAYDMRRGGDYAFRYSTRQQILRGGDVRELPVIGFNHPDDADLVARGFRARTGQIIADAVESDATAVAIDGDAASDEELDLVAGAMGFTGSCQSTSALTTAKSTARSRAYRAYNAATSFNTWYKTYFGNTSSYVSTVRSRFYNSYYRMGTDITFNCTSSCPSGAIAYTYKSTCGQMWICSLFWSQTASFKAHAVGHESYHWTCVAGADDVTYGLTNCKNLAISRPYDALRNADNYAYAADYAP